MKTLLQTPTQKRPLLRVRVPFLALCSVFVGASCAPAQDAPQRKKQGGQNRPKANGQNANGAQRNPQAGDATAFAQIGDAAPKKRLPVPPPDAPLDVPLKATNYPLPDDAIFVSPDAKPNGAGTQNSPKTLRNALQTAPAGATIVLRGGVYRDGDLPITRQMTLQAFPNELPWLDGSDVVAGWVQDGDAWRRDDWNTLFSPTIAPANIDERYPLANNRDMVWVDGRYLTQVGTRAEVGAGKFFVDYAAKKLYLGEDPAGKTVEATTRTNGLLLRGRDIETATGSVIRGLGVRRFAEAGVENQLSRTVLENNTIAWNGNYGVQIRNFGQGTPTPNDVVLRGNTLSCNGQNGVRGWMATRLLAENNTFSHNNVERYRQAWGGAGIKVMRFEGMVFRNNVVANNYAFGFWMDEDLNDATVVGNHVYGNEVAGLMFEISQRALIAFNVVHDNNVGLMVSNATKGQIWNNTFADNKVGVNIKQGRRPNHQTPEEGDLFLTRDIVLKNNLFAQTKPNAKNVFIDAGKGAGAAPQMIAASDFNAYVTSTPLKWVQWLAEGKMGQYQDLNAFRAASGQEKNGVSATLDPFVNAAQGDYRLKAGTIAGAAQPLPAEVAAAAKSGANVGFGALGS